MVSRSYDEKLELIQFIENHPEMKRKNIANLFGVKPQTLHDIYKSKDKIKMAMLGDQGRTGPRKRLKSISYPDVDEALHHWYQETSSMPKLHIDNDLLLRQARYFAKEFGHDGLVSSAWIDRFKKRYGISKMRKTPEMMP